MFAHTQKKTTTTKQQQQSFYFAVFYSCRYHIETSQINLVCKSVDWFLYNRQTLQGKGFIVTSIILFIKVGFSPLVVLYTSVSRVIMFLMWMAVLLSSSMSLSRFKVGSFYILYRELFFGFDSFCFVVLYYKTSRQGNSS